MFTRLLFTKLYLALEMGDKLSFLLFNFLAFSVCIMPLALFLIKTEFPFWTVHCSVEGRVFLVKCESESLIALSQNYLRYFFVFYSIYRKREVAAELPRTSERKELGTVEEKSWVPSSPALSSLDPPNPKPIPMTGGLSRKLLCVIPQIMIPCSR